MTQAEFCSGVERVVGVRPKNIFEGLKTFGTWLAANHPKVVPEGGLATIAQAVSIVQTLEAMKGATAPKALPSALTIAVPSANVGRLSAQGSAAVATLTGTTAPTAPKPISTDSLLKLARSLFNDAPSGSSDAERRAACLKLFWIAHVEAVLPKSLQGEIAAQDFPRTSWRPAELVGYERSIAAMRKASLKKLASKLNLS